MTARGLCVECAQPIRIKRMGSTKHRVPADNDHDLCEKCWKALHDSLRAGRGTKYTRRHRQKFYGV